MPRASSSAVDNNRETAPVAGGAAELQPGIDLEAFRGELAAMVNEVVEENGRLAAALAELTETSAKQAELLAAKAATVDQMANAVGELRAELDARGRESADLWQRMGELRDGLVRVSGAPVRGDTSGEPPPPVTGEEVIADAVLRVRTEGKNERRRAGFLFTRQWSYLRAEQLDAAKVQALKADDRLEVEELG